MNRDVARKIMNKNPYEPVDLSKTPQRFVKRYMVCSALTFFVATIFAMPAAMSLYSKWENARLGSAVRRYATYDLELFGLSIGDEAMIGWSLALSLPVAIVSVYLLYVSVRNRRRNLQERAST